MPAVYNVESRMSHWCDDGQRRGDGMKAAVTMAIVFLVLIPLSIIACGGH
jgi:hypothetical protein